MTIKFETPPCMIEDLDPVLKLEKSLGYLWPCKFSWTMMANIENALSQACSDIIPNDTLKHLKRLSPTSLKSYAYPQGIFFNLTVTKKVSMVIMLGELHALLPDRFSFTLGNLDYSTRFTYTNVNTPTIRIFKAIKRS